MKRMYFGIVLFFATLAAAQQAPSASQPAADLAGKADGKLRVSKSEDYTEAYLPVLFPSSHAANLLALKNGDVLLTWFSGTKEGGSDVAIVVARLPKGADQWSQAAVVDHEPGKSFQNPVLFQAPDGRVWLFHTEQDAGKGQANANVLVVTSDDNGHTWTSPKPLFTKPGAFTRQPLIVLSSNEWLLPMYYTPSRGITKGAETNYSVVEITRDAGKTWKECLIPQSLGYVQPSVVQLDHHFVAFFRSRYADWIYKSTSEDGCTWTPPARTELPNNNASIQVAKLKDGKLAIAFNNSRSTVEKGKPQAGPRKPLSVALSEDGGRTWEWVRDVETGQAAGQQFHLDNPEREEYSYPSIMQLPNGKVGVAYTYRRETIKFVSFDENWVKHGTTAGVFKGDAQQAVK